MGAKLNISGMRFGLLKALSEDERRSHGAVFWRCICDCGNYKSISVDKLSRGLTKSCGCIAKGPNKSKGKHGLSRTPEYKAWLNMIDRCKNPKNPAFHHYGGRGISVCESWINSFMSFFDDMGERPSANFSLDRKDNELGYFPSNCRWATGNEQHGNSRKSKYWFVEGVKYHSSTDAAKAIGVHKSTIQRWCEGLRLKGEISQPKENCFTRLKY